MIHQFVGVKFVNDRTLLLLLFKFASGPASCRRRRPPGNAFSGHSSLCVVVWWKFPQEQAGYTITPHR